MYEGYFLQEITLRLQVKDSPDLTVRQASDVVEYLTPVFEDEHREMFIVVPLNARHQPLGYHVCHVGYGNDCPVHMREVFLPCIVSART